MIELQEGEIIVPILGYEGYYSCTNLGRIYSHFKLSTGRGNIWIKPHLSYNRYYRIQLSVDAIRKKYFVHRLIISSFLGKEIPNGKFVNHINGIKLDNRLENLELVTASENMVHAFKNNLVNILYNEERYNCKIPNEIILEIRKLWSEGYKNSDLSIRFSLPRTTISNICHRRVRKTL